MHIMPMGSYKKAPLMTIGSLSLELHNKYVSSTPCKILVFSDFSYLCQINNYYMPKPYIYHNSNFANFKYIVLSLETKFF